MKLHLLSTILFTLTSTIVLADDIFVSEEEGIDNQQVLIHLEQDWTRKTFKDVPDPKKLGEGAPTMKQNTESYEDVFGNPHKPKKAKKNKDVKKKKERGKNPDLDAYKAGLPGFVIADIDPYYYYEFMGADMKLVKAGKYDEIKKDDAMGEMMCKRLAWGIQQGVDIRPESTHWMKDKIACLFQVLMDENVDEVLEWLEEQVMVIGITGDSPLTAGLKHQGE